MTAKKKLSPQQEFEIMKLVLDKFVWLGVFIMAFGLYSMVKGTITLGFTWIIIGAIVLILFLAILIKEYEVMG